MSKYAEAVRSKTDKPKERSEHNRTSAIAMRKMRTNKLIKEAGELRDGERRCVAIKKTGVRCKKYAIKGGFVCPTHGGSAPQVKAKAQKRLLAMVEPGLIRLNDLMHQDIHPPTALGAIRTMLERAGTNTPIGAVNKDPGESKPSHVVNFNIAIGGIMPSKLEEMASKRLEASTPINGEVVEVEDEDDDDSE